MLKLKSKLVAVLAVVTSFFLIGSVAMLLGNKNASAEVEWAEGSLSGVESSYVVGDKLNISTVQLVYEGETYTVTEKWMYTPSSQLVKFEGDYTFEETGNHELKCIAQVGDEQISKSKLIKVDDKSYNTNFATVEKIDALTTVKSSTQSGLHVNIPYTDSFDWGEVIDLRDSSEIISFLPYQYSKQKRTETQVPVLDENGEQLVVDGQPVFETVVNPTEKQADKIYVRITDAYDKTNYVDVRLLFSIANNKNKIVNQMPAYSAGHRGNPLRAMSTETTRDSREGQLTMINGEEYFVVYNNFGGYPKNGEIAENSSLITLYFDVNTQQVSVKQATLTDGEQTAVINDLDAPEIYGNNVFKGFTTGEVYLSIFAERYEGTRLDMEIASIGTKSGDELVSDSVLDLVAPQIVLDISQDQYDNKLFVATGSEVSIVPVKYYDINLAFTTEQVLYNDTQNVTLKDGKFIASKQGKYTVVYKAVDTFGQETIKEVVFNSQDCSANDGKIIQINVPTYDGIKTAGSTINLPKATLETPNTYTTLGMYVVYGDDYSKKVVLDVDNPTLKLENAGKYTIVYEYSDFVEKGEYKLDIVSTTSTIREFGNIGLPKYLLASAYYTFDALYVKTYDAEFPQMNEATVEISEDGGDYKSFDYKNYFVSDTTQTVQLKYTYAGQSIYSHVMKVVANAFINEDAEINLFNYFQSDDNLKVEQYGIYKSAFLKLPKGTGSSYDGEIDFVNALSLSTFSAEFQIPTNMDNFSAVEFVLSDYFDHSNQVVVSYQKAGSLIRFATNQGYFASSMTAFTGQTFRLTVYPEAGRINDMTTGMSVNFDNVFESDKVLLTIRYKGIPASGGDAGIVLVNLCGQPINAMETGDSVGPIITYAKEFEGRFNIGTVATISKATAIDVICPEYISTSNKLTVTVRYKANENSPQTYVSDINGIVLNKVDATKEYKINLADQGEFIVTYAYTDQNTQYNTSGYSIVAVDTVAPSVEIAGGYNEFTKVTAKLGTKVKVQDFVVTDNYDTLDTMNYSVVVFDPFFSMFDLTENGIEYEDMSFDAKYLGTYKVVYYFADGSGNMTVASYLIEVVK